MSNFNKQNAKNQKNCNSTQSTRSYSLETISEENSFFLCMKAQKVSLTGFFKNDRVICIDKETICYYSKVPSKCQYTLKEMQKQTPKISFNHSELHSVERDINDSKMLTINVVGQIVSKGSIKNYNKIQSYKFIFQNEVDLCKYKSVFEKIIENGKLNTPVPCIEDQYISLVHNY